MLGPWACAWPPSGGSSRSRPAQLSQNRSGAVKDAGVDLIIIETMTDLYEVHEAIHAAQHAAPDLPIVASMTFTRDDRTLLGDPTRQSRRGAVRMPASAVIGVNCSGGPAQLLRILKQMRQAVPEGQFLGDAQRGLARTGRRADHVPGRTPSISAIMPCPSGRPARRSIGGCCGTTPEHIRSMRQAIDSTPRRS